jgi:hypothetical protein
MVVGVGNTMSIGCMRITFFGATGGTGKQLVEQAPEISN